MKKRKKLLIEYRWPLSKFLPPTLSGEYTLWTAQSSDEVVHDFSVDMRTFELVVRVEHKP